MNPLANIHYTAKELLNPQNPILINLIGIGGTGSHLAYELADVSYALQALGHPGFQLRLFDADTVQTPNIGRQKFSESELYLPKAVAVANRINRYYGFNWQAIEQLYNKVSLADSNLAMAPLTISCVDKASTRFEIAEILKAAAKRPGYFHNKVQYWLDCGNGQHTGQVLLSTMTKIEQPKSKQFKPVGRWQVMTDEFGHLLKEEPSMPSCSMAEALEKQDLFINRHIASRAAAMVWKMISQRYLLHRGVFCNLQTEESRAVPIPSPVAKLSGKKALRKAA